MVDAKGSTIMKTHVTTGLVAISILTMGCSVQSDVERTYTMEIDGKASSPSVDRAIDADRIVPHLPLVPDAMGVTGPRMISLDPAGDVREGLMVSQDLRPHSGDMQERIGSIPGVRTSRSVEIGEDEGGEETVRSLAMHPVLLARVRFDCRRNLVTYLSYHTADTFTGPFAHSFVVPAPRSRTLAGTMREAACTGASAGLKVPRGRSPES